jgi:hypothetical protein
MFVKQSKSDTPGIGEKPYLVICCTFVILSSCLFIFDYRRTKSLKLNIEYADAVIYNLSIGMKANYYLYYKYVINDIKYQGNGRWYPKSDTLSIGDTILIVYDKSNPSFSKPERDY